MTWRDLVFEICNKIPEEQFDDEAKIVLNDTDYGAALRLHRNTQDWYLSDCYGLVSESHPERYATPIIKQGEWTIE